MFLVRVFLPPSETSAKEMVSLIKTFVVRWSNLVRRLALQAVLARDRRRPSGCPAQPHAQVPARPRPADLVVSCRELDPLHFKVLFIAPARLSTYPKVTCHLRVLFPSRCGSLSLTSTLLARFLLQCLLRLYHDSSLHPYVSALLSRTCWFVWRHVCEKFIAACHVLQSPSAVSYGCVVHCVRHCLLLVLSRVVALVRKIEGWYSESWVGRRTSVTLTRTWVMLCATSALVYRHHLPQKKHSETSEDASIRCTRGCSSEFITVTHVMHFC